MRLQAPDLENGLTLREAAKRLGKSEHWLRQNKSRLGIPHSKIGGTYSFDAALLNEWILSNSVIPSMPHQIKRGTEVHQKIIL